MLASPEQKSERVQLNVEQDAIAREEEEIKDNQERLSFEQDEADMRTSDALQFEEEE